ncbi:MAG: adenylate kinase [Propionibacterium sp.]|nr:MAG: adenylate kinase [Propionibacterium sp.]
MRLLIMGAPGAGKGTQAAKLSERYQIPAISTGEIFRDHIKRQTDLGKQVKAIIDAGEYVPDELTEQIVTGRLEETLDGFLLDGFPRTLHQVEFLNRFLGEHNAPLDAVLVLDADMEDLVQRLVARAAVEGRSDDNEETIRHRMEVYTAETADLIDAYEQHGLVLRVDGNGTVDEVSERLFAAVDALGNR